MRPQFMPRHSICKWWLTGLRDAKIWLFSVAAFWTWNWCGISAVARTSLLPMVVILSVCLSVTHVRTTKRVINRASTTVFLRLFFVELRANTRQTVPTWIQTLTFDLWGHSACRWCGSTYCISTPTLKFRFRRYGSCSVTALIGLVTLTFDLSTSKWGHGSPVSWASFLPILACYAIQFST